MIDLETVVVLLVVGGGLPLFIYCAIELHKSEQSKPRFYATREEK